MARNRPRCALFKRARTRQTLSPPHIHAARVPCARCRPHRREAHACHAQESRLVARNQDVVRESEEIEQEDVELSRTRAAGLAALGTSLLNQHLLIRHERAAGDAEQAFGEHIRVAEEAQRAEQDKEQNLRIQQVHAARGSRLSGDSLQALDLNELSI